MPAQSGTQKQQAPTGVIRGELPTRLQRVLATLPIPSEITHEHSKRATSVAAVSDEAAVTGNTENVVTLWNLKTGEKKALKSHEKYVACVAVGDDLVLSADFDGLVSVLNTKTGEDFRFKGHKVSKDIEVWSVAVSGDGRRALSATNTGEILLWDTKDGTIRGRWQDPEREHIGGVAFVPPPNDSYFLSAHGDGTMKLWDIGTLSKPGDPAPPSTPQIGPPRMAFAHGNSHPVNWVAVHYDPKADRTIAVTASFDLTLKVWHLEDQKELATLRGHTDWVWRAAISPDGTKVASASQDGTVRFWDISDPANVPPPKVQQEHGGVMGVAFAKGSNTKAFYTTGTEPPGVEVKEWTP